MQYRDETDKPGYVRYAFDSMAELGDWIHNTPRKWRQNASESYFPTKSWDLNAGYGSAVKMARFGWNEGAQDAQRVLASLRAEQPAPNEQNDFYGYRPNVPRFCAGAPDSMIRRSDRHAEGKVICLYVPINALASVTGQQMNNFGLAMAQYIRQLELEGNRIELYGAFCSLVSGKRLTMTWKIKDAGQQLDLAVLTFSLAHPAMFRRIGFAARERSTVKYDPMYGRTRDLTLEDIINPPIGAKIVNGMNDGHTSIESAYRKIEQQVNAQ